MELVRAQNRIKDSAYQNMLKNKERTKAIRERIRESEVAYEAAKEDVARLKARLKRRRLTYTSAVAAKLNNRPRLSVCSLNPRRPLDPRSTGRPAPHCT